VRAFVTLGVFNVVIGTAIEAWEFGPASDLADVVAVVAERRAPPCFVGHLISTHGDALTIQVTEGGPSSDPRALYYVKAHGAFLLARREEWPPARGCTAKRVLLMLLAFPQPHTADSWQLP
jgi:hypothetical protein